MDNEQLANNAIAKKYIDNRKKDKHILIYAVLVNKCSLGYAGPINKTIYCLQITNYTEGTRFVNFTLFKTPQKADMKYFNYNRIFNFD